MAETETIDNHSDNPETPNVGNGVVVYDDYETMKTSWTDRMIALADEMATFGFAACFTCCAHDRLDNQTDRLLIRRGNYYTVIGLLTDVRHEMMSGG